MTNYFHYYLYIIAILDRVHARRLATLFAFENVTMIHRTVVYTTMRTLRAWFITLLYRKVPSCVRSWPPPTWEYHRIAANIILFLALANIISSLPSLRIPFVSSVCDVRLMVRVMELIDAFSTVYLYYTGNHHQQSWYYLLDRC